MEMHKYKEKYELSPHIIQRDKKNDKAQEIGKTGRNTESVVFYKHGESLL